MANVLNISQASYARLENEETKVTVDRLYKIADILENSITDFFDTEKNIIQNQTNHDGAFGNGYVQNLHIENRDVYERLIQSKDEQLKILTNLLKNLISDFFLIEMLIDIPSKYL